MTVISQNRVMTSPLPAAFKLILLSLLVQVVISAECEFGYRKCNDGECVAEDKWCDGYFDCSDGEDENSCHEGLKKCDPPLWFKCKNGHCINALFVCDSQNDCLDLSDEPDTCVHDSSHASSGDVVCLADEFSCISNKECIPKHYACDGEPDCLDGSDETVGCGDQKECSEFRCKNNHCIPNKFHCDGIDDCRDNSDEEGCTHRYHSVENCKEEYGLFLCHDKAWCFDMKLTCDKFQHCLDNSDEEGCTSNAQLTDTDCKAIGCSNGCQYVPEGKTVCTCPAGYKLDNDHKSCVDIDECQVFGTCYQKCKNTIGSFECQCDDGYALQADMRSCKAKGGEALMLFASRTQIRGIYLQSQVYFTVAKHLNEVVGVAHNGKHVFWTDIHSGDESIVKSNEDGSEMEVLINSGLAIPEDLAVDYVTGNIYFTDAGKKHIGVCTEDGLHCTVLHNADIDKPRALALYSQKGIMYWSDWGETPMIATSGMDGSNPKAVIEENIEWPNGLTLDVSNDRIYWVDAKAMKIECSRLDGSDRRVILEGAVKHPFALAVFEDTLYWSDWEGTEIQQCNKFTGKNHSSVVKEKKKNRIDGVHIYHPALQPRVQNPCHDLLCSDICLLAPNNSYACACPEHSTLGADLHSCRRRLKQNQIAVGGGDKLFLISPEHLGKQDVTEIHIPDIDSIGCMAYNSLKESLIISDSFKRKIFQYKLSNKQANVLISSGLGQVVSMSYDYYGNNLYLCDAEKKSVEVWNLNTFQHLTILKSTQGSVPLSVVAIPEYGYLYVAISMADDSLSIRRVNMDGTQILFNVAGAPILGPKISLSYDPDSGKVYWSDSDAEIIESITVNGTEREIAHIVTGTPMSIATQNGLLVWTRSRSAKVYWYELWAETALFSPTDKFIELEIGKDVPLSVVPINGIKSHTLHPCQSSDNGGCSHLCLVSTDNKGSCHCPMGMHLNKDNKTCIWPAHCMENQFKCRKDDMCIPKIARCDGHTDCRSGEDEEDCSTDSCNENQFKCSNGQCISLKKKCDYEYDCSDRSDEVNCIMHCDESKFQCASGECIPVLWKCDFHRDCEDGSDESVCAERSCPPYLFQCKSGTCIPKTWECDREIDCPDASDEHECVVPTCKPNEFTCGDGRCIHPDLICNGVNDCIDSSDEIPCDAEKNEPTCLGDDFLCSGSSHICVSPKARCNGTAECPRGEDETDCSNCQPGEFQCKSLKCIYHKWVCDKTDDCGDNSDEDPTLCSRKAEKIGERRPCDQYQCGSNECIPLYLVCNEHPNCEDGSDEGNQCESVCKDSPCEQICHPTPLGAKCGCNEGYRLNSDGHTCTDIDECADQRCSQVCSNSPGSFTCSCVGDYLLKSDRLTCKATGEPMKFILNGEDEITSISYNFNNLDVLLYEPGSQIMGLDVDAKRNRLYWSTASGSIHVLDFSGHRSFIEGVGHPGKLSFDWVTENIYFVDNGKPNSIRVCHMTDKKCADVLSVEKGYVISHLMVDPPTGLLFYSQVSARHLQRPIAEIYQYSFADQNRTLLVSTDMNWVNGIAVDHIRQYVYWSDLYQQVIEKVRFDGKQRQVVFKNEVHRPESLILFEDSLYWLTRGSGEIKKCRLAGDNKGRCETTSIYIHDVKYMTILQTGRQPHLTNPCTNVCDMYSLCVLSPEGPQCICEDGKVLPKGDYCNVSNAIVSSVISPKFGNDYGHPRTETSTSHARPPLSGSTSAVISILLTVLAVCTVFASYVYFKKRKTNDVVLLETMHFQNPSFGLSHLESTFHHSELNPGEHQYENPTTKLVQHPDGKLAVMTNEKPPEKKVIERVDLDGEYSDESDQYEVDMKTNLIH